MSHFGLAVEMTAQREVDVCSLVVHRVARVHPDHSTLGINAIERSLGTTEHIHTLGFIEMRIESGFIDQWHIVDIDTHRRTIHARTNATNIDGRRET